MTSERVARLKCARWGAPPPRDLRSEESADWSAQWEKGRLAWLICPGCQTPTDAAEAEANAAELRVARKAGGQFVADPVLCMTGTMDAPGTILYGEDHIQRVLLTGQAENLKAVEHLPQGTRCVPTVGGVLIHLPAKVQPEQP